MGRFRDPVFRHRITLFVADAALAALAFYLAFRLRFLDTPSGTPDRYVDMLVGSIAFVALGKAAIFTLLGLHAKWWRYFSLGDVWPILRAAAFASAVLLAVFVLAKPYPDSLPRSIAILDFVFTVALLGGARAIARAVIDERKVRAHARRRSNNVLVVGAGSGGQMVVREMQLNPDLGTRAVGFIDDDPRKRGMKLLGLSVLGTTEEIGEILDRVGPDEVVIAIPSAPGSLRATVVAECRERGVGVRTLPTVFELLRGGVRLTRQLREVRVEDVLGREPVVMELERVGSYLRDEVVMVTGAGGSIGRELVRQIARVRPRLIVLLDHAEDNLFEIEREMLSEWHFTQVEAILADCKESARMTEVMRRFRPEVVFHAAAYKHVPLMEVNPLEAIRNNAIATRVVAEAAAETGVRTFVLISTDKAVNPQTVMGATKAMAEWLIAAIGGRHPDTRFLSVRFGNVLGSSGSVVPIFRSQIERGGPVTVTDPEMTRYFMTIPEAVQLVIRAGDLGEASGDVYVLDMGDPVPIVELARNMIRLAGYEPDVDIAIEFVGPRPGEKLHEELLNAYERPEPTSAPRIMRAARGVPVDPEWVDGAIARLGEMVAFGDGDGLAEKVIGVVSEGAIS